MTPSTLSNALANDKSFNAAERAQYGVTSRALLGTVGRFENVSKTKTSGVDLTGSARFMTGLAASMSMPTRLT